MKKSTIRDPEKILAFLQHLHKEKEVRGIRRLMKRFGVDQRINEAMINKGLLEKFDILGNKIDHAERNPGSVYKWKHPEVLPNIYTAKELSKELYKMMKRYYEERKEKIKNKLNRKERELVIDDESGLIKPIYNQTEKESERQIRIKLNNELISLKNTYQEKLEEFNVKIKIILKVQEFTETEIKI